MTCTHEAYFPQPTIFLKFMCLRGGGGILHFYHHYPEVKFLCVWGGGGGGCTFIIRNGGGYYTFPDVERFPRFHIFPFSTCPLV